MKNVLTIAFAFTVTAASAATIANFVGVDANLDLLGIIAAAPPKSTAIRRKTWERPPRTQRRNIIPSASRSSGREAATSGDDKIKEI